MLELVFAALWYILPAYIANASAVIVKGRTPIDADLRFLDGRPLLGRGKTIKGFIFGTLFGTLVGVLQGAADAYLSGPAFFYPAVVLALFLSAGAMFGDSIGSFVKRRFDLKRGEAVPFLDQWDFVLGAFLFAFLAQPLTGIAFPDLTIALLILVLTAFLHVVTNYLAYKLKFKRVPW